MATPMISDSTNILEPSLQGTLYMPRSHFCNKQNKSTLQILFQQNVTVHALQYINGKIYSGHINYYYYYNNYKSLSLYIIMLPV